jgi:hypothetical protein
LDEDDHYSRHARRDDPPSEPLAYRPARGDPLEREYRPSRGRS